MIIAASYIWMVLNTSIDWQQRLKWMATSSMLVGATIISVSTEWANIVVPYLMFMLGHVIWGTFAHIMKDKPLFWLNVLFLPLDCYAIYLRLTHT